MDFQLDTLEGLKGLKGLEGLKALEGLNGFEGLKGLDGLKGLEGLKALPDFDFQVEKFKAFDFENFKGFEKFKAFDVLAAHKDAFAMHRDVLDSHRDLFAGSGLSFQKDRDSDRQAEAEQRERERETRLYDQAREFLDQGKYDRAIERYTDVIALKGPRADAALYWKAWAQNRAGQRPEALTTISTLAKRLPEEPVPEAGEAARSGDSPRQRSAGAARQSRATTT